MCAHTCLRIQAAKEEVGGIEATILRLEGLAQHEDTIGMTDTFVAPNALNPCVRMGIFSGALQTVLFGEFFETTFATRA
jgi:hypothetical protein